jgi:hypothetical protein
MLKYVFILHFFFKNIYEQSKNYLLLRDFRNYSNSPKETKYFFGLFYYFIF